MKRKFFRATHICGEYRKELDEIKLSDQAGFVVHMLFSREALSFKEVIQQVKNYEEQFPEDGIMTEGEIALALIELLENNFVKLI